jgi:hypothetical protein
MAIRQNNHPIAFTRGGPQLMFHLGASAADIGSPFSRDSWWIWNIAVVFAGEPDLNLALGRGFNASWLRPNRNSLPPTRLSYPLGMRTINPPRNASGSEGMRLSEIVEPSLQKTLLNISVATHLGTSTVIRAYPEDIFINYGFQQKPLPPNYGGPYQVCNAKSARSECTHFVSKIEIID